ncbi:MAG TPA: signal peptidase I [Symbiobacteriaceae bacterium]|jgi:signal peptidase I
MLKRFWDSWGRELLVAVLIGLFIRAEVAEARVVPTPSMVPTVLPGDRLLAEKLVYRFTGPHRGDIIVFRPPLSDENSRLLSTMGLEDDFLKRVIGLPGDKVEIRDGKVLINGTPLTEPYIAAPPNYVFGPKVVPPGQLFVLGDNRNNSYDSHAWGFLDESAVRSRAVVRFWPPSRIDVLH